METKHTKTIDEILHDFKIIRYQDIFKKVMIAYESQTAKERDELKEENERLEKLLNECKIERTQFATERNSLQQLNSELLEALESALPYMEVFMIRDEEPLVGENLKTDLFKVRSSILKAKGQ